MGSVDDGLVEGENRSRLFFQRVWKLGQIGIEADADEGVIAFPRGVEFLYEAHVFLGLIEASALGKGGIIPYLPADA